MRFDGKLEKWNDDRGFGFLSRCTAVSRSIVHVSAFAAR